VNLTNTNLTAAIIADLGVPGVDSAANLLERDVIGNKADTIAGDSLVSLVKSVGTSEHQPLSIGTIRYVSKLNGNDANDGLSPEAPLETIGAGITASSAGDGLTIGAGTYTEIGLDINLAGMMIEFQGVPLIDPVSGTALTLSGASIQVVGMHKITPAAGAIGLLISGAECHAEHGKVIGGATCVRVTGPGVMIEKYAAGFPTAIAYDLQADQGRLLDSSTVGNANTIGVKISNGADTGVVRNLTSEGHADAPVYIDAGSVGWTILNPSFGPGDGKWVDVDSANTWNGIEYADLVYHSHAFDGSGPTSENLFRVYGTVAITGLTGDVDVLLSNDIGNGFLELDDGTVQVDVTDSAGPSFNSLAVETFIHKIDDAGVNIKIELADQVRLYEDATKDGRDPTFQITAKAGVATYLRFAYSGAGTSGVIHWHCRWEPRTEDGFVEAA